MYLKKSKATIKSQRQKRTKEKEKSQRQKRKRKKKRWLKNEQVQARYKVQVQVYQSQVQVMVEELKAWSSAKTKSSRHGQARQSGCCDGDDQPRYAEMASDGIHDIF